MADPRHQKLAKVLVHYSLAIKPGEKFLIGCPSFAEPLIREIYREALQAGAFVRPRIRLEGLQEIFFKEANDEQLTHISEIEKLEYDITGTFLSKKQTRIDILTCFFRVTTVASVQ